MQCNSCGFFIGNQYKFCANCGVRVVQAQIADDYTDEIPPPECPVEFREHAAYSQFIAAEPQNLPKIERYFFGKPALVFCLSVIAILSITASLFIGLYLYEHNKNASGRGSSVISGETGGNRV
jgi:hypothetical protein